MGVLIKDLALILHLITEIALLLGIFLCLLQLRHYRLPPEREAALLMMNSIQTEEFSYGVRIIQGLPIGLTMKEIEEGPGEKIKSMYLVIST